jgi:replicative DNA helicase
MNRPKHGPAFAMEQVTAALTDLATATPDAPDAELTVIGACLVDSSLRPPLRSEHFWLEKNRVVFAAMEALLEIDDRFDLTTVQEHLRATGKLTEAGGAAHLAMCIDAGCTASQLDGYVRQIREAARRREMVRIGTRLIQGGYEGTQIKQLDVAEWFDALVEPLGDCRTDFVTAWAKVKQSWGEKRVLTGLSDVDDMTTGFGLGELVVIGARSGFGKTMFSVWLGNNMAKAGHAVTYLTLEETDAAITRRLISVNTGISNFRLKSGNLAPHEVTEADTSAEDLKRELPLTIVALDKLRNLSGDTVVSAVRQASTPIVIIDHLQKIQTRGDSRVYGLEAVLNQLHAVALSTGKILIVCAQLNRDNINENRLPRLSDLRDCGAIEIAPRIVLLLHWPWKMDAREHLAEDFQVIVAKHSDGGTGIVPVKLDVRHGRFEDSPDSSPKLNQELIEAHKEAVRTAPGGMSSDQELPF